MDWFFQWFKSGLEAAPVYHPPKPYRTLEAGEVFTIKVNITIDERLSFASREDFQRYFNLLVAARGYSGTLRLEKDL